MKMLRITGIIVGAVILLGVGVFAWASYAASRKLSRTYAVHRVDFPVPYPFPARQVTTERASPGTPKRLEGGDALDRGRHLVESRYPCRECHGMNFGGGVMVDNPAIGRLLGPNLTTGKGSVTSQYRAADWDRIVRHGIKPDGTPALMPSQDFRLMSDQELSDIVVFIRSQPPVDSQVPPPTLGPVGKLLLATGKLPLSADLIGSHERAHADLPPPAGLTLEFGRHIAATCMGCHRHDLGGGPIIGGDPSWPSAANLTPGPDGLREWTFTHFVAALREGKRPDGTPIRFPMTEVVPYAVKMSNTELQALWSYLRSVPALADRE